MINDKFICASIVLAILGIVLPTIEFTPATYINATHINYTGFAAVSGNVTNLNDINGSHMLFNESNSPFMINITFTNITSFDYAELKWKYYSTVGASTHVNDIEIWCHTENQFVDLPPTFTNQIEWNYFTKNFPDSMHFIEPNGNVTIRINHSQNGNANHRLELDTVRLVTKPQYEQINASINYFNNTTTTGAGCEGNCSFDGVWVNSIRKNNTSDAYGTYINLSSPFRKYNAIGDIFSHMSINDGSYYNLRSQNATSGNYSDIIGTPEGLTLSVTDGVSNNWNMYQDHTRYLIDTREYILNQSELSLGGANLTNCLNCWNETINNTKVNKSGDNMTGTLNITKINNTYSTFNDGKGFFNVFETDNSTTQRTQLSQIGVQWWRLRTSNSGDNSTTGNVGYIFYSTPSSKPGINFFNDSLGHRMTISMCPAEDCLLLASSTGGSAPTSSVRVYPNGNLTVDGTITLPSFAGFGNGYVCYDNSGNWYRGTPGC